MIIIDEDKVTIPRATWDKLQESDYYHEILEAIQDLEAYYSDKDNDEGFIDYDDYKKGRAAK
jgi:hypothetical protein